MLHLRFHRRTPSNPTSPVHDRTSWDVTASPPAHLLPGDGVLPPDVRPRSSASVPFTPTQNQPSSQPQRDSNPPVLPPIARVVSDDSTRPIHNQTVVQRPVDEVKSRDEPNPSPRSPHSEQSRFIGGRALEKYRRDYVTSKEPTSSKTAAKAPAIPSTTTPTSASGGKSPATTLPTRTTSSFVSPTDLQNAQPTGKRPPGARMTSEPPIASNPPVTREQSKAKKGLPFLKNPMSTLLLRRKASQTVPDLSPSPRKRADEPIYDPRIRGTRVHDFSAPRQWKPIVQPSNIGTESTNSGEGQVSLPHHNTPSMPTRAPPVPPKDSLIGSVRTTSSHSKGRSISTSSQADDKSQWQNSSTVLSGDSMSRKVSAASVKSSFSAIPRHMKSTSSRFSFDMIGAAEQEKLLEERHRQRQQDKISGQSGERRDSRFDEFDEDAFDYDAMDYDDGLEERIPGVNADLDEYEEDYEALNDPDNDQENFAGFSFQRSEPTSSLTSPYGPGITPTEGDMDGHFMEYSQEGEYSSFEQNMGSSSDFHIDSNLNQINNDSATAGLGIQGLEPVTEVPELINQQPTEQRMKEKSHLSPDDELYFNDGMIHEFDGEGDGSAFDESIFDLNDTDQYGRPIPSMFANALAQRNAALEEMKKRESDMTTGLSGQSIVSRSTTHTSLSTDMRAKVAESEIDTEPLPATQPQPEPPQPEPESQPPPDMGNDTMAAYQAALAAAAHEAAASGKFRRDSSPNPPTDETVTLLAAAGSSDLQPEDNEEDALADYEYDDGFSAGLDDYELDDDAIIAEANASALANDSDGWYGQEFGFYSAPITQSTHVQTSADGKVPYQYSHGGFFGPSGMDRTASGRIVSREPNLTPITERSEYSNRNSLMSMGWPQGPNNAGTIQSPGLAQLAMMAEDHDTSLSALLRLRSKAWGGSQASLVSSREGSPYDRNGATSPLGQELSGIFVPPGRKNSAFSIYSQDSAGGASESGSPTLTMGVPNVPTSSIPSLGMSPSLPTSPASSAVFSPLMGPTTFPPLSEVEEPSSPGTTRTSAKALNDSMIPTVGIPSKQRPGVGHKHKGSADSISYVKEEESGEARWILERRRTGEAGETELFERKVVGGGRI